MVLWLIQKDRLARTEHSESVILDAALLVLYLPVQKYDRCRKLTYGLNPHQFQYVPSSVFKSFMSCVNRIWDTRSGKSAANNPTPDMNLYMAWSPHDPNIMATASNRNVVSFIDIRRNKVFKSVKNNQMVS